MGFSIFPFIEAQAWGAILILGFIGWGCLLLRWLIGSVSSVGLAGCCGLALAILLGGILNLLHLVTGAVLIGFTLLGVGLALWQILRAGAEDNPPHELGGLVAAWKTGWSWPRLALIGFLLLFLFRMASTPRTTGYATADDQLCYLALPVKVMQAHYLPSDPFSERRIAGGVGADHILQAMVLSFLPLENVQMADQYLGVVLIVLITLALARQFELSPGETMIFAIFSISAPPIDRNLTFTVLPTALFLALALIATNSKYFGSRPVAQALLIGLLAATISSLKSTYLPHVALFCGIAYFLLAFVKGWRFALRGWCFALLGALVVLIPWVIATRMTCGTYLYPLFGTGYDYTSYHEFPAPYQAPLSSIFRVTLDFLTPLLVILIAQLFLLKRGVNSLVFFAITLACLLGTLATDLGTGGESALRYNFPIVLPSVLLTFLQFSSEIHLQPDWKLGPWLRAGSVAMLLFATAFVQYGPRSSQYSKMWARIEVGLTNRPADSPDLVQQYAKISAALPRDGLVLTALQHPYLLASFEPRILIADWPGCASLPPGWPIKKDGEALAKYLLDHSVRYLAYTYNEEGTHNGLLKKGLHLIQGTITYSVVVDTQLTCFVLADKQFLDLAKSRHKIYDDGSVFILDLSTRGP